MNSLINHCQANLPNLAVDQLIKRYRSDRARNRWAPVYQKLLAEAERLSAPAAVCHEFPCADVSELNEWLPLQTSSVILVVCTLGPRLDEHLVGLSERDLVSAVILNEISLALINAMTRNMHATIRSATQMRGLKAGAAYRPGVGRWPLTTQEIIFKRIPAQKIGVTLDEFLLMRPVKSTSLIIPVMDRR
jgi:hypothetical protein